MPDIDLEPHEYRPRGAPRIWSRGMVLKFGLVALAFEALMWWVLLGRPDVISPNALVVVVLITGWPIFLLGAVAAHLSPAFFFQDDKKS